MSNRQVLRYDIAVILILPFTLGIIAMICTDLNHIRDHLLFIGSACVVLSGVVFELPSMYDRGKEMTKDNGLVSGLTVSLLLLLLAGNQFYDGVLLFSPRLSTISMVIGIMVFFCGALLRFTARRTLGRYFSHTVRVITTHELQTGGIYKHLRHPAYSGTVMIVLGISLLFGSWLGFLLIAVFAPVGLKRIRYEEKLLHQKFGHQFEDYASRTKKLVPYIF